MMNEKVQPDDEPSLDEQISVSEQVERYAYEKGIDVLSAIMDMSSNLKWDPEWFIPYITDPLKEKIRVEGEALGLLKRTDNPMVRFE